MGKVGDLWVRLKLKTEEYKKGLDKAKKDSDSFGESVKKSWLKVTAGIAAATAAVRGLAKGVSIIADFEKANSVLAGVLGRSVSEIKALSDSAEMLGRSTAFTATQVTGLQTELAKLGFGEGQIMSMQKAVLNFATALGVDLSEAASFTGATLRTFGLKASDAEDALNILAVASDKSALGFSALSTAMPIVGPVAKSLGFSLRDTSTLLGVLANSGFDASSSATALRNIFLYLADSSSKLSKAIGKPVKTLPDLLDGLDRLKSQGISVGEALELTDKRAVSAFNTLIDGTASARELRSALDDVNGAVDAKAKAQIDNISGSVALLKSAWEGFILSMKNSKGIIKGAIDFLATGISQVTRLFKSARVSQMQEGWQSIFSSEYKQKGKDEALKYIEKSVKDAEEEARRADIRAHKATSGSVFGGGKEYREAKRAKEELEAVKAAAAVVIDQINNDVVAEALSAADEGGADAANELIDAFEAALSRDKAKDAMAEFRAGVADEADAIRSDMEDYDWTGMLDGFEKEHAEVLDRMTRRQRIFNDFATEAYGEQQKRTWKFQQKQAEALGEMDADAEMVSVNVGQYMGQALAESMSDGIQTLTDALTGLEDIDASTLVSALLKPFADMAKQMGEFMIADGMAIIAAKDAVANPYTAIAAGAALVALGAAMTSGLNAIASSAGSTGSASSSAAGSSGAGTDTNISTEMTIYVKGKISGKDILISGDNARNYYRR